MKSLLILAALTAANYLDSQPAYVPSQPIEFGRLPQRARVLLVEVVPLGSSREAVKYKISGLKTTSEDVLEGAFPDHRKSDSVRVTLAFKEDQLVCISYQSKPRNAFYHVAKLYLNQTFGKPYLKNPKTGGGIGWCAKGMGIEMGELMDSTGVKTGWRFRMGCPDSASPP